MTRRLVPPAALGLLVALVAGCGGGSPGAGGTTVSIHEQAVKFAQCMRAGGVSGFPDPSASGSFTLDGAVNGSSIDPNSPAFKHAIDACRNLEPPGFTGAKATPDQMRARLAFARCVRENGVPDFPDPTRDGPIVDTNRIPSTATPNGMSILNAAMHRCGQVYAGRLGLTGP